MTTDRNAAIDLLRSKYAVNIADSDDGTEMQSRLSIFDTELTVDLGHVLPPAGSLARASFLNTTKSNPFQVEFLLEEAATLIERCLGDREQWRVLRIEGLNNRLMIGEFLALDGIHAREIAENNFYEQPYLEASASYNAEDAIWNGRVTIGDAWNTIFTKYSDSASADRRIKLAAYLGRLSYTWPSEQAVAAFAWDRAGSSGNDPMVEAAERITREEAEYAVRMQQYQIHVQFHDFNRQNQATEHRLRGLKQRMAYEERDRQFRKERRDVSRTTVLAKNAQTAVRGGILDFDGRATQIKERFDVDFLMAYDRILTIHQGLSLLYFSSDSPIPPVPLAGENLIDRCVLWLRSVTNDLKEFSRRDQTSVVAYSLVERIGESAFAEGKLSGWEFSLSPSDLPNLRHVRLRGMLASATADSSSLPYRIVVEPPRETVVFHNTQTKPLPVEQDFPPVLLGRVESPSLNRTQDICGLPALWNASPFGTWRVRLNGNSTQQMSLLTDIRLDFVMTFQISDK